jgi:uncharacterized OB-fold protein
MSEPRQKPVPVADELSRPFWEAAREHRLVVQRCGECGYHNHPPRSFCDACLSQQLAFVRVSGSGTIFTFTVMHQRDVAGFEQEAPFVSIVVELAEQPQLLMVANIATAEREKVRIGAPVEAWFEDRGNGVVIPQFRLLPG